MPLARSRPDPKPGEPQSRAARVRSINVETRTITVVASTETEDAHGTVLVQDWNFTRFDRNPVILWAHNATLGLDELPIGRATRREVVNGALEVDIQFAGADISLLAERVFQAYRQEFLRAVSVGFNPGSYRWEEREGREVLVFFDNELIEVSCVPIGSNPDALARALAARSHDGPAPAKDDPPMTDEEKALLALARRALELLGEKDPANAEARLRGLLDAETAHATTETALTDLREVVATSNRATLLDGAIRDGKLPPKADLEKGEEHAELRSYLDSLSPLAPKKGERSPLEVYLRTLPRRTPAPPSKGETPPGKPAARTAPAYARGTEASYAERAAKEKAERRAQGQRGARLTDAPAPTPDPEVNP